MRAGAEGAEDLELADRDRAMMVRLSRTRGRDGVANSPASADASLRRHVTRLLSRIREQWIGVISSVACRPCNEHRCRSSRRVERLTRAYGAGDCSPGSIARGPLPFTPALVGRPAHGLDHGRRGGQGPALPLHRRAAAACTTPETISRHLREYFDEAGEHLPGWAAAWPALAAARRARRHGCSPRRARQRRTARPAIHRRLEPRRGAATPSPRLRRRSLAFTVDLLGEATISEAEAERYQQAVPRPDRGPEPRGQRLAGRSD